jgi:CDP-diacylglycerol--glycerol-3-phosphate 3-phosphatidyltransferase
MAMLLTLARFVLVLPFAALFFVDAGWAIKAAFAVFAVAALTDFLDGHVARAKREESKLGAALDPIADKVLIAAALLLLVRNGVVHGWAVIAVLIILLREILVGGLREAVAQQSESLPVTKLAKFKTGAQVLAAGLLLAAAPTGIAGPSLEPVAAAMLWLAAILTLATGADYARRAAAILRRAA